MLKVGITGQAGFVGTHLYNQLGLCPDLYERIPFEDTFFNSEERLREFVKRCDVIVHLAAMNRHEKPQVIYDTNILLVKKLITAMEQEQVTPHILFSSSTQESFDNLYGQSKQKGRQLFEAWAKLNNADFTGLVMPNVFGEFSQPNYNTFIATFAHKLIQGEEPQIVVDNQVKLIYVASLCRFILNQFANAGIRRIEVPCDFERKVSDILSQFKEFTTLYYEQGFIPTLTDRNDVNLFNTFRSFISPHCVLLTKHTDERGFFVETIKLGIGGQVSFSTTKPGITRGDHFHTRKIERFTVVKGKARIQLRKIGTDKIYNFELDGETPAYVDMPIWYTHNITNIGTDELYTQFWINEWYNLKDRDTYFEKI
jgi:UDP-2-acetamido-2,6-beta-L-arabino-hexul-4-ose reductase